MYIISYLPSESVLWRNCFGLFITYQVGNVTKNRKVGTAIHKRNIEVRKS